MHMYFYSENVVFYSLLALGAHLSQLGLLERLLLLLLQFFGHFLGALLDTLESQLLVAVTLPQVAH